LDVAVIKATSSATHTAPKEKHVLTLRAAVGAGAPRARVAYVNAQLVSRLRSATDWLVSRDYGEWIGGGAGRGRPVSRPRSAPDHPLSSSSLRPPSRL